MEQSVPPSDRLLHRSVMTAQVLESLCVLPGEWYVDATLGQGGHTEAILDLGGNVVAFDIDPLAIGKAREHLVPRFGDRLHLVQGNHRSMDRELGAMSLHPHGVLLDSGWAMTQADSDSSGLSFEATGPLDMRMDPSLEATALSILEHSSIEELASILSNYGDEPLAMGISRALSEARSRGRLPGTPKELAAFVSGVYYRKGYRRSRRHPATRTFMALRIAVNGEIDSLVSGLSGVRPLLVSGGRLVVLTFHSREDREVKHLFRNWSREGLGVLPFSKPKVAEKEELAQNPRARSAKMRVFIAN
ncbi:MAG: 16S rRNA (cytosine(1402)-N(4))-methyltransferase RsmH [Leptospirales bacterium]